MQKVLTAEQMREVDRLTTERYGIPSILLMENAAHAVARVVTEKLGGSVKGKSILILCGKGNNGGDGAALARILWTLGAEVAIFLLGTVSETKGDARVNFEAVKRISDREFQAVPLLSLFECTNLDWNEVPNVCHYNVFVDAMVGTGLKRPLSEEIKNFVSRMRAQTNRELSIAIDIPSGLDSDSSIVIGPVFPADVTVAFTAPKPANVLPPACSFNGRLIIANIGSPTENFGLDGYLDDFENCLLVTEEDDVKDWLISSQFVDRSYKNKRGHTLIVAGSEDYSGAAVMCGNSAMRSGVGLTTLLVPASCKVEVASRVIPEVIVRTLDGFMQKPAREQGRFDQGAEKVDDASSEFALAYARASALSVIGQADSILVGPGLNATDKGVEKLVREIVESRMVPVVLDAGALGLMGPLRNSPPYEGGVAAAAADGVVLSGGEETRLVSDKFAVVRAENHPVASEQATPLLRKEGRLERAPLILTPHEGEFLRLLGTDSRSVIKDRVAAVREFAVANDVILVLKGERVLIGSPDGRVVVNPTGNSGLGKAGNGDTLAGILAGFVAQAVKFEIDIFETVVAAVYVAGMAGDVAEKKFGKRVMTASDVRECLVDVFGGFEGNG